MKKGWIEFAPGARQESIIRRLGAANSPRTIADYGFFARALPSSTPTSCPGSRPDPPTVACDQPEPARLHDYDSVRRPVLAERPDWFVAEPTATVPSKALPERRMCSPSSATPTPETATSWSHESGRSSRGVKVSTAQLRGPRETTPSSGLRNSVNAEHKPIQITQTPPTALATPRIVAPGRGPRRRRSSERTFRRQREARQD